MSQIIYYHGFQNIFVLYRGGKETDGYSYGECSFGRKEITEGFLMHVNDPLSVMKILHIPNDGQDHKREVNFLFVLDQMEVFIFMMNELRIRVEYRRLLLEILHYLNVIGLNIISLLKVNFH